MMRFFVLNLYSVLSDFPEQANQILFASCTSLLLRCFVTITRYQLRVHVLKQLFVNRPVRLIVVNEVPGSEIRNRNVVS